MTEFADVPNYENRKVLITGGSYWSNFRGLSFTLIRDRHHPKVVLGLLQQISDHATPFRSLDRGHFLPCSTRCLFQYNVTCYWTSAVAFRLLPADGGASRRNLRHGQFSGLTGCCNYP